jgi:DNA adenine methylase
MDTIALLQYPGSKARLAQDIIGLMPPHKTYVEAFGGSAAVLLSKKPAPIEVYNDINGDVVNLFRVVRDAIQRQSLRELLAWTPYSREELADAARLLATRKKLEPVEHARLTFVLYNQSVSGMAAADKPPWSYTVDSTSQADEFRRRMAALDVIGERLSSVQIESRHFLEVFSLYDSEDTLWYLDPPYLPDTRTLNLYEFEMYPHEHKEMVQRMLEMKGQFILSGYDTPIYKPLEEAGWKRVEIDALATMSIAKSDLTRTEVLWTNIGTARLAPRRSKRARQAEDPNLQPSLL